MNKKNTLNLTFSWKRANHWIPRKKCTFFKVNFCTVSQYFRVKTTQIFSALLFNARCCIMVFGSVAIFPQFFKVFHLHFSSLTIAFFMLTRPQWIKKFHKLCKFGISCSLRSWIYLWLAVLQFGSIRITSFILWIIEEFAMFGKLL